MLSPSIKETNKIRSLERRHTRSVKGLLRKKFFEENPSAYEKWIRCGKKDVFFGTSFYREGNLWANDFLLYLSTVSIRKTTFSKKFFEKSKTYMSYSDLNQVIAQIKVGMYSIAHNFGFTQPKLSSFCLIPLVNENELFLGIYFDKLDIDWYNAQSKVAVRGIDKKEIGNYAQQRLYYYDIALKNESKEEIEKAWALKMESDKYASVDFDENGMINPESIAFREKKQCKKESFYRLHEVIAMKSKEFLCKMKINDAIHYVLNDPKDFIQKEEKINVLDKTAYVKPCQEVSYFIKSNNWNLTLSKQQRNAIEAFNPIIISGRPGTGKTRVILLKMLSVFLNLQFSRSLHTSGKVDWDDIKKNYDENEIKNLFRVVYTSFNQDDCDNCLGLFSDLLRHKELKVECKLFTRREMLVSDSFRDVKAYPLFANFRKLLFMIDGSLTHQFFSRSNLRKFEKGTPDCQINYKEHFEYPCNNYIEKWKASEPSIEDYLFRSPEINSNKPIVSKTECTYASFVGFYNDLIDKLQQGKSQRKKLKRIGQYTGITNWLRYHLLGSSLTSNDIYSQIYSVIKGSAFSYLTHFNGLTREAFHRVSTEREEECKYSMDERNAIYDVFLIYEQFKDRNGLFDMQDMVNHLIRQVKIELKAVKLIDYLFIDEIQELTENQIFLFVLVSRFPVIFSGDTCQTISTANRYRIRDIRELFKYFKEVIPGYPSVGGTLLSINYRINASIFKLTTFFANLIKQVAPNTVDKLSDDYSVRITPFIPSRIDKLDALIDVMEGNGHGRNIALCCQHCFICRSPEQASGLLAKYDGIILALDIEKCKGMEYELVVIYNFFSSSPFKDLWHILFSSMTVNEDNSSEEAIAQILQKEDLSSIADSIKRLFPNRKEMDDKAIIEMIVEHHKNFSSPLIDEESLANQPLHAFCAELKQFYVMITRAKTFLFFYEEDSKCTPLTFISSKHNLIASDSAILLKQVSTYFNESCNALYTKEQIIEQAEREYASLNYSKAKYLYRIINLKQKEIEIVIYSLNDEIKLISSDDTSTFLTKTTAVLELIAANRDQFTDPLEIEGGCLESINRYEEAALLYDTKKQYEKSGLVYLNRLKDYSKAFTAFKLNGNFKMCFVALERGNYYDELYDYIESIKKEIGQREYSLVYVNYVDSFKRFLLPSFQLKDMALSSYVNHTNERRLVRLKSFQITLNERLSRFFARCNPGMNTTYKNDKVIEEHINESNVLTRLEDLHFKDDMVQIIKAFYMKDKQTLTCSIIEILPEVYYSRSNRFPMKEYFNEALCAHNDKRIHISKVYTRLRNGIDLICTQAGINAVDKEKYIKDITMFSGCFKYAYYSPEQKCIVSSLLLDEKKMKQIKLSNESDVTKAICLSAYFRLFVMEVTKEMMANSNKPNKDLIEKSVKKLDMALINSNAIFDNEEECMLFLKNILIDVYVNKSIISIISSIDYIIKRFFNAGSGAYSLKEYLRLMTHFSAVSIYFFLYGNSVWKCEFNSSSNNKSFPDLALLSKKFLRFGFKLATYSSKDTLSDILLFTLFSPFGVSYCPRITSISPLHLYQNINMCLINHNAPLFSISSSNLAYLIKKKIIGMLDAKGTTFIIKAKTAYQLFMRYYHCFSEKMSQFLIKNLQNLDYEQLIKNLIMPYSFIPTLNSIDNLQDHMKSFNKTNLPSLVGILEDSICDSAEEDQLNKINDNSNASKLFYVLLPILTKADSQSNEAYLQSLSTLVYYLCYQLKSTYTENDKLDPKLNLYLFLMILYDSYGVTFRKIEGRFIFKAQDFNELLLYNNPNVSAEILSLLNMTEYSPMIALIWIKKLHYHLFNWLNAQASLDLIVYDINEILTTKEEHPPKNLNETVSDLIKVLTYFIETFLPKKGVLNKQCDPFESKFYEMNVYCFFLSILGLYSQIKGKGGKSCIDLKPIEAFISSYKKDSDYYKTIKAMSEAEQLKTPKFFFVTAKGKSVVHLIMRKTAGLFPDEQANKCKRYRIKKLLNEKSKWKEQFEIEESDTTRFVFSQYSNHTEYSEALLYMLDKHNINEEAMSKEVTVIGVNENDKLCFASETETHEENDEVEEEEEEKEGIDYEYLEENNFIAIQHESNEDKSSLIAKNSGQKQYNIHVDDSYSHSHINKQRAMNDILRDFLEDNEP